MVWTRIADNNIIKNVLTETIHKKRPIGRPRMMKKLCSRERYQHLGKKCVSRTWNLIGKDGEHCLWQIRFNRLS